ncbi:hypothetical protein EON73_03970 [bacterium]|nr:MAG: hypothetical protein EON73_03970 [bacterium]
MRTIIIRHFVIVILTFFFQLSFAQENNKIETDTSIVETMYHPNFNSIKIFNELKDKSKMYYTELYLDSKKIKEQGIFTGNNAAGVWKEFFQDGKLKRVIDYNKGIITYFDKKTFPFLGLQNLFKLKGDSIIKKNYSQDFFDKNIVWSLGNSYIYNGDESGNWTDEFKKEPTKFLLRYNVKLDGRTYKDRIEFEINSEGQVIPNDYENIYGFEQLPKNSSKTFELNREKAIGIAKQKGLQETDSTKAESLLSWENSKSKNIYNGRFRFYVLIKTATIKGIKTAGRSSIINKFDVYVFNPWTAEFVEKRKMKAIHSWEEMSGTSTGLLPDN